jgi:hypothetical protein
MNIQLLCGDALEVLKTLPSESVHCIVTSPPYFGQRDYKVEGQLGQEDTVEEYVHSLVVIFREARRVLRKDGLFWLNLGDKFRKDKQIYGVPWRVAFALQDDGWYLRLDNIWFKTNGMPESVTDRPVRSHEYVFQFSKSPRYFYDRTAVGTPMKANSLARLGRGVSSTNKLVDGAPGQVSHALHQPRKNLKFGGNKADGYGTRIHSGNEWTPEEGALANLRSVWPLAVATFRGPHFATFPVKLAETCIKASASGKGVCPECGAPWTHNIKRKANYTKRQDRGQPDGIPAMVDSSGWKPATITDLGWKPTCSCGFEPVPATVLDPFSGAGTTGVVCQKLGMNYIGIDLNQSNNVMTMDRLGVAHE